MSKSQDFLYDVVRRGYEREADVGEAIVRSLPFFATSLGALLAGVSLIGTRVDAVPPDRVWIAYMLLGGVSILALSAVFCIAVAVLNTGKTLRIASEADLVRRAVQLDALHRAANPAVPDEAIDAMVLLDVRSELIEQTSVAAGYNRVQNVARLRWQKRAFATLMASLILAFVTIFTVLVENHRESLDEQARRRRAEEHPVHPAGAAAPAADADAGNRPRRSEVPSGPAH